MGRCQGHAIAGQSTAVEAGDLRLAAHRIADVIYEKLTGDVGVFSTRIAYITKGGGRHTLRVADADGEGGQVALTSAEPIISPAWSADGKELAYVSFESQKAVVYTQDAASGKRRPVANFRGSNSAPAWSPDGRTLAVTLSRDGISRLYLIDRSGANRAQAHQQHGDRHRGDVRARWPRRCTSSATAAAARRSTARPVSGGNAQRVTFGGNYNISPAISPDGRTLAYISRQGGAFRFYTLDLGERERAAGGAITDTSADESPSFAPNGRLIIYASRAERPRRVDDHHA